MMINDRGRTVGRRERMYRKVHRVKLLTDAARAKYVHELTRIMHMKLTRIMHMTYGAKSLVLHRCD